ncbi:MAG TPA: histidine kinase [Agriterribacter sp.]|nr:histidine kinase [Agriterribacter sp.]
MIKRIGYILIVSFIGGHLFAQPAIDTIHPFFKGKLDQRVSSLYDFFEIGATGVPTAKPPKGKRYNDVILSVFHSKNLYINTVFNKQDEPAELNAFRTDKRYVQITGTYQYTSAVPLFDSVPVIVTAYGIDSSNKDQYRFRVMKNQAQEIVPWSRIKFFSPVSMYYRYNADGTMQTQMAYLGQFLEKIGNSVTVEVKNLDMPDTAYSVSAVWIKRAPEIIATFTPETMKQFITVYKYRWKYDDSGADGPSYYSDIILSPVDSLLVIKQKFTHNENSPFFYLNDKVKDANLVEYNLTGGKDSSGWTANDFDPNIIRFQQLAPGNYTLLLRYAFQRQTVSRFSFTIIPAWYQTVWFKLIAGAILLLALLSAYLVIKTTRQQIKIKEQQTLRRVTQAEIRSVKSQFNPHFVFNALNSIQGLITKNDMEGAYTYLNDFSRLLRNALKESEKDFISLSKDISLIDHYLKLEQLRFGFRYQINVDKKINKDAIEVPVLLLQPVIENAVKHGVSRLQESGLLTIEYHIHTNDIRITVTDNGTGYTNRSAEGYGLKLTDERVALMNQLLKERSVAWQITNTAGGTQVIFMLKNWLL